MADRQLVVRIIGDDRSLQQAFARSSKSTQTFGVQFANVGRTVAKSFGAIGLAIGTAELAQGLGASIEAASDLNEQVSKSRQIFRDASRDVEEWAETTADAFGISQREALTATGTFGNLLRVVGLAPKEAARMSQALVELAADLASFNNADPSEVLRAIQSGLVGEVEPLRRYGVLLSEARVQQVAMAQTGKQNVRELTNQEKAFARYELILRDTAPAQGDFARTSESLANQSRKLHAQLDDLSANLGQVFLPAVTGAVTGLNDFLDAMESGVGTVRRFREELKDIDWDIPPPPSWMRTFVFGDDVRDLLFGTSDADAQAGPAAKSPGQGIGEDIARRAEEAAAEAEKAAREAEQAKRRRQKAFDELIKGLGLKLERAELTTALTDDLAVLREIERAVLRRIRAEGRTFELVEQLTAVQAEIAAVTAQQVADAQQKEQEAFDDLLGFLQLDLDAARVTASFQDDLAALDALEKALRERIRSEGRTLELERQLFQVQQERRNVLRQQREARAERRQGRQFEAIGLTEQGDERTPGVGALRRRLQNLREQVKGTVLDTQKTRSQLQQISEVLSGEFGAVGKEVRQAILQMFNDISEALDEGAKKGPLTKFQKRGVDELLDGLGLSPEEIKVLRQRFAQVGRGGTVPGQGGPGVFGFAVQDTRGTGVGGNIIVHGDIVVQDPRNADAFIREVQKKAQRSAGQRRGTRAGGS